MALLAIVDSDYKFLFIDVGAIGLESDGGIFAQSKIGELLQRKLANLPPAAPLPGDPTAQYVDYFFVGDDAFALQNWMTKTYSQRHLINAERIYNYRLSRARRVVENVLGILANH